MATKLLVATVRFHLVTYQLRLQPYSLIETEIDHPYLPAFTLQRMALFSRRCCVTYAVACVLQ